MGENRIVKMSFRDINLIYSGGSGGFLLLHLLLLSGKFLTEFYVQQPLDKIIAEHWNITDHKQWKKTEKWPNNDKTFNSKSSQQKLYFYCNPTRDMSWNAANFNLAIYTDYVSQHKLSFYKHAHWFCDQESNRRAFNSKFNEARDLLRTWRKHYNNIKDSSWPACVSFRKISKLPVEIQEELLSDSSINYFLKYQFKTECAKYSGVDVYEPMLEFLETADLAIKLQDLVNSQGMLLVELNLIPEINQQQLDLLNHWKSLHSQELLNDIGIY